jgi:hypothetical protein
MFFFPCIRVPNIPGFYVLFRAWSHWRALSGAKHLDFLASNLLLDPVPDISLSKAYYGAERRLNRLAVPVPSSSPPSTATTKEAGEATSEPDFLLLDETASREIADMFGVPELQVEIERAVEQVSKQLSSQNTSESKPTSEQNSKNTQ